MVDPTILTALNDLSTCQAHPTVDTMKRTKMLMDYLSTFPSAKLRYYAGDMQLHVESDAAYLVLPGARSRIAGHFYLSAGGSPTKVYAKYFNASIYTECSTLKKCRFVSCRGRMWSIISQLHRCN